MTAAAVFVLEERAIASQLDGALPHSLSVHFLASSIAILLAIGSLAFAYAGRIQVLILLAILTFLSILSYGNLLHYRAFGMLTSMSQLRFIHQLADVGGAVLALVQPRDLLFFVGATFLASAALVMPDSSFVPMRPKTVAGLSSAGVALQLLVAANTPCLDRSWFGRAHVAGDLGFAGYHVWEAIDFFHRSARRLGRPSPQALDDAASRLERAGEATRSPSFGIASGKNVIVLQVESLQGFAFELEFEGRPVTPHLEAIARESTTFDRFFHVTAMGRTSDAQFVSNCSLMPSGSEATAFAHVGNDFRCLPALLGEEGFGTYSIQTLQPDFWNASAFDRAMGFQRSYSGLDFEMDERIGLGLSDRFFLRQAEALLASRPEPFYAYLLTTTSHAPYRFGGIPRRLELGELEGTPVGDYLHAIHYTDAAIGEFVSSLRVSGLLERSILVLMGDHDGLTRRDSNLAAFLPIDPADEAKWLAKERRVPLMIRVPGAGLEGRRSDVGSQLDIAPTLFSLLGFPRDGKFMMGSDLFGGAAGKRMAVFPDGSAIATDVSLVAPGALGSTPRCFAGENEVPHAACGGVEARARAQLELGSFVLERDAIKYLREGRRHVEATPDLP